MDTNLTKFTKLRGISRQINKINNKTLYDEIFKLILLNKQAYTVNSNGIYIDIALLPYDIVMSIETLINIYI